MASTATRFPIRFDHLYAMLSSALLLPPSQSYVDVADGQVVARMGWGFRSAFPKSAIKSASMWGRRTFTRGIHGLAGRWLVNGSGDRIVAVDLEPRQRAFVLGFPVKLRQLLVSVENPDAFISALQGRPSDSMR